MRAGGAQMTEGFAEHWLADKTKREARSRAWRTFWTAASAAGSVVASGPVIWGGGVQWRSGGVEHPHDTPPYPLTPSPTSAHNSMANLVYNIKRFIFLRKIAVA